MGLPALGFRAPLLLNGVAVGFVAWIEGWASDGAPAVIVSGDLGRVCGRVEVSAWRNGRYVPLGVEACPVLIAERHLFAVHAAYKAGTLSAVEVLDREE
jgi:hypothetical protein